MGHDARGTHNSITYFAAPERDGGETLRRQAQLFSSERVMKTVTDTISDPLLILNSRRQLIYANSAALTIAGAESQDEVLGLRPGELLRCEHAQEMRAGCGTSEFCATCGAVQVILSGLKGREDLQECRITTVDRGAYDLLVRGRPLEVEGEDFTVFSIRDISHEKRRRTLERLFYHDVLNTAGGLQGMSQILDTAADEQEFERTKRLIHGLASELIEEIEAQRDLTAAENSELQVNSRRIEPEKLVEELAAAYRSHGSALHRSIRSDLPHQLSGMESDPRLLRRILGNMLKNGLESTSPGGTVTIGAAEKRANFRPGIEFFVHNDRYMPRRVQLQVFQRSFSTKGSGRGLGTYSMRLLSEHYLGGRVRFESSEEAGTTFYAWIPLSAAPGENGNGEKL